MNNYLRKLGFIVLGTFITFTLYAANPATKEYVDTKIAMLQAEITQILITNPK